MRMHGVAAGEHTPAASVPYHGFLGIMAGGERGCINRTQPQPVSKKKKNNKKKNQNHQNTNITKRRRASDTSQQEQRSRQGGAGPSRDRSLVPALALGAAQQVGMQVHTRVRGQRGRLPGKGDTQTQTQTQGGREGAGGGEGGREGGRERGGGRGREGGGEGGREGGREGDCTKCDAKKCK